MTAKSSSRSSLILAALLAVSIPVAGQTPLRWLTAGPTNAEFETTLIQYLQIEKQVQVQSQAIQPGGLTAELQRIDAARRKEPIAVECPLKTYEANLRDPEFREVVSRLGLRVMNPRLFSVPFYILSFPDSSSGPESLQVAYITLPLNLAPAIQDADLLNLLSEVLGKPRNAIKLYRERDAYTAAKNFYSGAYRLVGIYEEEPSTLLDEFNINLTQELRAKPPRLISLDPQEATGFHEVAPDRLGYVYFSSTDPLGSGKKLMLVGITRPAGEQFPVVLANLPKEAEASVELALSYAYFLAAPSASRIATSESDRKKLEQAYLYNSYVEDPENRMKGLAFLSFLMLMKNGSSIDAAQRALFEDRFKLFLKTLEIDRVSSKMIFDWLGVEIPKLDKRLLFTDDVSRIYQDALAKIDRAAKSTGDVRVKILEDARRDLIAAILQEDQPGDIKGSRGLWSVTNYNPYYQLARVTFYLQLEGRK